MWSSGCSWGPADVEVRGLTPGAPLMWRAGGSLRGAADVEGRGLTQGGRWCAGP